MAGLATTTTRPWYAAPLSGALRLSEPAGTDGMRRSWIMLLPEGQFEHPQYGALDFTRPVLDTIARHFHERVRGIDIALDYDHRAAQTGDSRAPGWIEEVAWRSAGSDGNPETPAGLWGLVRWTALGLADVEGQIYRYISAEYRAEYTNDQTGKTYQHVLVGATLTNRPFMKQMPAVVLSDVSTRPWGEVDKAKLPDSAFLDPTNRRLPIYEGTGPVGTDGKYTKRGKLNIHGARAALAAIHGARSGKAMTGLPAGTVARLQRLLAKHDGASDDTGESADGGKGMAEKTMTRIKRGPTAEELAAEHGPITTSEQRAADEQDDETLLADLADATDEEDGAALDDMTGDGSDAEMYDDAEDGEGDEPEFDAESDTHGQMTTADGGHTHGKFGKHSHDDDASHADAPTKGGSAKMSEPTGTGTGNALTLAELAEQNQLLSERLRLAERELLESRIDKRLRSFRSAVFTLAEQGEQETRLTFSKRFREKYRAFMLSDQGVLLSEAARGQVDDLLTLALSSAAIVPLDRPGIPTADMEGRRVAKDSSTKAAGGDKQLALLDEEMDNLALSEHRLHINEMRQLAQRGDRAMAEAVLAIRKQAGQNIGYRGV